MSVSAGEGPVVPDDPAAEHEVPMARKTPTTVPLDRHGFAGYIAVANGTVMSVRTATPRVLSTYAHGKTGWPMVQMVGADGRPKGRSLARLILAAFGRDRGRGWEPVHRNGDPQDCRWSNLRWQKKKAPDRERAVKLIRGLMRRYDITPDDLRGAAKNKR